MNVADFILIQVYHYDEFYELARVRRYQDNDIIDKGYYCEGFGQNNGDFYEFTLHLGKTIEEAERKIIVLGYPVKKHNGEKVKVIND